MVRPGFLEEIAQADEHEIVQQVQEYFADYYAVNPDLFSLNVAPMMSIGEPSFGLYYNEDITIFMLVERLIV